MDALTSARRKVERADVHLVPLLEVVKRFVRMERPYAIAKDYDPETRRITLRIGAFVGLDEINSGLQAGDVVHNLRSALDHLVFGLASRQAGFKREWWPEIAFPIKSDHRSFMSHSVIRHLSLDEIAVLERYQPFPGRDKKLLDLHDLWNADKHRLIQLVLIALPQSGIHLRLNADAGHIVARGLVPKVTLDSQALNRWTDLGWIEVSAPGPNPDVDVDPLTVEITLGQRRVPVERLAEIRDHVSEIVEAFAPFFPESQART